MKSALGAAFLVGLPALAHAQEAMPVPSILQTNAAAAASANAAAGGGPGASASAMATAGPGAPAESVSAPRSPNNAVPPTMPPPIQPLSPSARLNTKERHGVALARRWAGAHYLPHADADGVIRFPFGATLPTIVCAPLQVCDLALQPGEVVNNILLGDKVRWILLPGISGTPPALTTHINIKPTDAGLVASMAVYTNKRVYSVRLVSTRTQWMPLSAFSYPEDAQDQWNAYHAVAGFGAASGSFASAGAASATDLDFSFRLSGDNPSWRPLRNHSELIASTAHADGCRV